MIEKKPRKIREKLRSKRHIGQLAKADTIRFTDGIKRYILTGIDLETKFAFAYDINEFNRRIMEWLLWYNTRRPHWSIGLISPLRYICNKLTAEQSQMCWTSTLYRPVLRRRVKYLQVDSQNMEDISKQFGKTVREIRLKQGFLQGDVAKRLNLHLSYISGIERGVRNPSLKVMQKIAKDLGAKVGDLIQ